MAAHISVATLLLIDPNPATRSVLKTMLTDAGHHVESVGGLIAARGVLSHSRPELVLVDLGHQRAAETLQGLPALSVGPARIVLLAHPEAAELLAKQGDAGSYRVIDRGCEDANLLAQVARYLGARTDTVAPALPLPLGHGPSVTPNPAPVQPLSDAPAIPMVAAGPSVCVVQPLQPVPQPLAVGAQPDALDNTPSDELENLYKDVGIEVQSVRRTLLYCDLHRLHDTLPGLPASEQSEVLATLLRKLEQAILSYDGRVCLASRNGFSVLFDLEGDNGERDTRPFHAAIEMVYIAQQFCGWLRHRFPGRGRQDFAISIALDTGEFDLEEGADAAQDIELRQAITRVASYATLGGKRGWTLTATPEAMQTAGQTCTAGERAPVTSNAGECSEILEVGALALNSTTSVHERIARMMQSNSALLRHGGVLATSRTDAAPHLAMSPPIQEEPRPAVAQPSGPDTPSATPDAAGGVLDVPGYRVLRPLGKGGMAEVFLATHLASGDERVLKMLPINDGEEEQLQRFIQEYALLSQIRDSNVARIHEQGFTQTHAYIAMEFLPGGELREAMKGGVGVEQALIWTRSIAGALMAVHAKGITHRDLKPANLMFRADGALVLADFGIAKGQSELLNRTASGHIVGSPYYLSPEQAESKPVDARCDLYSLGIILFEMLTGKKPFRASNLSDLIRQHVVAPIPQLPEALGAFQGLIDKLLAKRPADRIGSAALVLDELQALSAALERGAGDMADTQAPVASAPVAIRALRDVYSVAVIGFDDTEKIVLSSTLGLSVRRKPRFLEFDTSRADRPDLYLVDARDLLYLQTMLASNLDRAVPTVLIGSSDFGTGWPVLKRPLQWTKVFEAFDRALREHEATRLSAVS